MSSELKTKKVWPRTIAEELHDSWQRLKRKNDPEAMATALGVSRPIIDRALIYGHVSMKGLADKITGFLEARLNKEREDARRLNTLSEENK